MNLELILNGIIALFIYNMIIKAFGTTIIEIFLKNKKVKKSFDEKIEDLKRQKKNK